VRRFDEAGIAGLAIQLDHRNVLDAVLLGAADEASIPVVTFSDELDVTEAVNILLDSKDRHLQRVIDIHERFTRVALDGGTVSDVVATLHDLIGHPVALAGCDDLATIVAPPAARSRFDDPAVLRMPVHGDEHVHGEIQVLTGGATLDPGQLLALEIASKEIAVRQAHLDAMVDEAQRFRAITLERLVAGDFDEVEQVAERATAFGWDLSIPRAVLLASIDPPIGEEDRAGALASIAAAARATLGPDSIVWTRSATVAALLAPATGDAADRRQLAEGLRRELDARVRTVTISVGVGRLVDDISSLPDSFQEACRAVDVGRWAKGRHVTEVFDELGLERLFASTPELELADFVQSAIGPLLEHDRANNGELVGTLETWLQTRNMAEAARRMPVHYNTFKNRLDRIEAILGPVVADPVRSLECEVALYVARHYDGPWKNPPEPNSVGPAR
jgi:purine catabolism regulator